MVGSLTDYRFKIPKTMSTWELNHSWRVVKVEDVCRHDIFIWVFARICLGYENEESKERLLDDRLKGNRCRVEFLSKGLGGQNKTLVIATSSL
jgi:hypothetical protein